MARRARVALGVAIALALAVPAPAAARLTSYTLRFGPVPMGDFNVTLPRGVARAPGRDGYIVRMHARLVDGRGRRVTIRDVMLHHVVISRKRTAGARHECGGGAEEVFYGTGEENQTLRLPPGYGYRITRRDRWRMKAMLMSHSRRSLNVYVQYRVTVASGVRLTPVHPFWLRAMGCERKVAYPIQGGGALGSTDLRSFAWRVPYSGRIVAAGGHLHGGAKDMWLSQPRCGDRRLLDTRPLYGMPDNLYYRALPILHEPGPVDTQYFLSRTGIPVVRGETVRLSAAYDAEHPRWAVMATMHVYIAADRRVSQRCSALPADRRERRKYRRVRLDPPWVPVPLTGLDGAGRTFTITRPPWPLRPLGPGAVIDVGDDGFDPPHISLPAGAPVTWRFVSGLHNVRLANGPSLVGTQSRRGGRSEPAVFATPGHYELFCSLHPITMHEVVEVLPAAGSAALPARAGGADAYDELG